MCELNIAKTLVTSSANGPGRRYVIWLQGCSLDCPGCINAELQTTMGGTWIRIDQVYQIIVNTPGLEGVTFSGGEPFEQAECLALLSRKLHDQGLGIVCYSGYTLEDLQEDCVTGAQSLLAEIDLLIDGPYQHQQKAALLWRGSANQRLIFLTQRYKHLHDLAHKTGEREVELQINTTGVSITGGFDALFWKRLQTKLTKNG